MLTSLAMHAFFDGHTRPFSNVHSLLFGEYGLLTCSILCFTRSCHMICYSLPCNPRIIAQKSVFINIIMLRISNLTVEVDGKKPVKNFSLKVGRGESHALLGPNGSGKSSLCFALLGHPRYKITTGSVEFEGRDLLKMTTDERSRHGLFLGFQHPLEIPGMTMGNFLRRTINAHNPEQHLGPAEFYPLAKDFLEEAGLEENFIGRGINEGFSGGEKKRAELAQLLALRPKLAILDEIDSGLDFDALERMTNLVERARNEYRMGLLLITHYQRLLKHLRVEKLHVMIEGQIVESGGKELLEKLEEKGYQQWK